MIGNLWTYFSILSGPFLAWICGGILCLVPIKNVLKYPSYWYEDHIVRVFGSIFIMILQNLSLIEYWSNFQFEDKKTSCVILLGLGFLVYIFATAIYFSIWSYHFELYQPMPFNGHIAATVIVFAVFAGIILR